MDASHLTRILSQAPTWAPIALKFRRAGSPENQLLLGSAEAMVEHFHRNGRIAVTSADPTTNLLVIAKTILFLPQDAQELSRAIASFVDSAEIREMPEYAIALTEEEGQWYLTCSGGNKLLRETFRLLCIEEGVLRYCLTVRPVTNHQGTCKLKICGTDDNLFLFSQNIANVFAVQLTI